MMEQTFFVPTSNFMEYSSKIIKRSKLREFKKIIKSWEPKNCPEVAVKRCSQEKVF